jgi:hypothetical protein
MGDQVIARKLVLGLALLLCGYSQTITAQIGKNNLNETYKDESHCLTTPEIRGESDNSLSCFCRDAVADARYLYQTYLSTQKDQNLNGAYLQLVSTASKICGNGFDVLDATQSKDWRWNGPEVNRTYPSESAISQLKPDSRGFQTVEFEVRLTFRDPYGLVTKVENFKALKRLPATNAGPQ